VPSQKENHKQCYARKEIYNNHGKSYIILAVAHITILVLPYYVKTFLFSICRKIYPTKV